MNRKEIIRSDLLKWCSRPENFTISRIVEFIANECYCNNCECNQPNPKWTDEERNL